MTNANTTAATPARLSAFSGPSFAKNADSTEAEGYNPCPCCGRKITKRGMEQPWVEVVYLPGQPDAYFRTKDITDEMLEDSQGCYPVGPSCLRKLKKAAKKAGIELALTSFAD